MLFEPFGELRPLEQKPTRTDREAPLNLFPQKLDPIPVVHELTNE